MNEDQKIPKQDSMEINMCLVICNQQQMVSHYEVILLLKFV
jgi:hypothetical protein